MFAVTRDFAPPFRLIAPYFVTGVVLYVLSALFALSFDVSQLGFMDPTVIGWVHLYLLGFVMMVIFGAMAQLVPVVLETGHFAVDLYYVIGPMLLVGTLMMALGFAFWPMMLPFGGLIVLTSMLIFVYDVFMTIRKIEGELNFAMKSVVVSNTFLFLGVVFGILLALGYAGVVAIDVVSLLKAHVFLVVVGYILVTIIGLSMVLIPMFGLSHDFSWRPVWIALIAMSAGVVAVVLGALVDSAFFAWTGYLLSIAATLFYGYEVIVLYRTRARKEHDIYAKSLYVSYASMAVALLLAVGYLFTDSDAAMLAAGWAAFTGFFGFLITGHLYKIVPFLVWFERFSPLVGKRKVPMLADMVPQKSADFQFAFTALGVVVGTVGLLLGSSELFKAGASFVAAGGIFLIHSMIFMMRYE
jgi:hypothetical protein